MGYDHIAEFGQKGYHGVAIVSRLPFVSAGSCRRFCGKDDCRHISVTADAARSPSPSTISMCRPAATSRIPQINEKFAHKLQFIDELEKWFEQGLGAEGP